MFRAGVICFALAAHWALGEIREHPAGAEVAPDKYIRAISETESSVQPLAIASKDGSTVAAALRKPKGGGPFPALIFVHGFRGDRGIDVLIRFVTGTDGSPA